MIAMKQDSALIIQLNLEKGAEGTKRKGTVQGQTLDKNYTFQNKCNAVTHLAGNCMILEQSPKQILVV